MNEKYRINIINSIINKLKVIIKYIGPAFIVSVAYVDPGNFATNIKAGSIFNYDLLAVVFWSNIIAIFLQLMSAKLGIATNHNLPELCGLVFKKHTNYFLWICAEMSAIATDLAEFIGATLGFYLLFRIPMIYASILTGIITFVILQFEKYGQNIIEKIIFLLISIICIVYGLELFFSNPDLNQITNNILIPRFSNSESLLIAVGMLGATVMPHVIYLHSQLVQSRNVKEDVKSKKRHYKMEVIDIIVAMNIAFVVNAAIIIVSAAVFYKNGIDVESIEQAHKSLEPLLGKLSSIAFAIALLASGLSSSVVGTMAGQTIMKGFVGLNIPLNVRRIITMIPAIIVIILEINPINILVISQVALSFSLPMTIIPLLIITKNKKIMGNFVNKPIVNIIGYIIATIIISLNVLLLFLTFIGKN